MATDIRALPAFIGTDAEMRTWGTGINAQIAATGLVQVTGSGEIDWTTAVRPAINTYNSKAGGTNGYEIWRFADSLQSTVPVFIKIEYGIAAVADRPSLAVTVGSTHNGSGTLGGQIGTRRTMLPGSSKVSLATLNSYCSGSTSRLTLQTHHDPANSVFSMLINVERPKDASGANTADGVVTWIMQSSTMQVQNLPATGAVPAVNTAFAPFFNLVNGQSSNAGGNIALSPHYCLFGQVRFGTILCYKTADIGALVSFSLTHLQAVHTYMPLGAGSSAPESTTTLAILWE